MPMSPTQGIGVLSSIPFAGTKLAAAFDKGFGRAGIYANIKDNCGYDAASLQAAVQALNNDIKIGLIVTVGGLIAAQEAARSTGATLPFISLIGGTPGNFKGGGYFRGGVSLESFAHNPHRIAHLKSLKIPEEKICLLSNPNSFMSPLERTAWQAAPRGGVFDAGGTAGAGSPNSTATYKAAFGKISAAGMMAVVVSADPFFQATMDDLINEANQWIKAGQGRRICYPLHDYANPSGKCQPIAGHTLYGPDLMEAYALLGQMAAKFLAGQATTLQSYGPGSPQDH